ncbi:MAG: YceI family protein [Terracidiphilus sp.]
MSQVETSAGEAELKAMDRFVIDGRSSRFTVRTFASGVLAAMGHNPTIGIRAFSGEMKFDPEQLKAGDFRLAVKSRSLTVEDDISGKDRREIERLMHLDVLETEKFPEILYEAVGITVTKVGDTLFSASLNGNLTLHGGTRAEQIAARVALMGSMLRASGEFSISQSKYDIKPVSVAGGVLKLKDELRFQFEIIARRQE